MDGMLRCCSVIPVALLGLGSFSPSAAVVCWIATVLLANLLHVARHREIARALILYSAVAAPLMWAATTTPLLSLTLACLATAAGSGLVTKAALPGAVGVKAGSRR